MKTKKYMYLILIRTYPQCISSTMYAIGYATVYVLVLQIKVAFNTLHYATYQLSQSLKFSCNRKSTNLLPFVVFMKAGMQSRRTKFYI